jgi:light-regulated signal transduction histidine kinase (bacteriophytochrome)
MDFAIDGSKRMQTLVNGLLEYSRIGRTAEADSHADAAEALQSACALLQRPMEETHAVVTNDKLPVVQFDPTQLTQLFQNLIGNALKFRGTESPQIHVSAEHYDGGWKFAVSDNGIGIEPQYVERIFLIFQRLHNREKYPGTGMGLALCKRIVEHRRGQIWVESEPGKGSTFYFTIHS